MKFNFEKAVAGHTGSYIVDGKLVADAGDIDIFNQVKDSYASIIGQGDIDFGKHLTVGDSYIQFGDVDLTVMSNMLKILRSNLGLSITADFTEDCTFTPSSCEPLFKMEVRNKFN